MITNKIIKPLIFGLMIIAFMFYLGKQCASYDKKHNKMVVLKV